MTAPTETPLIARIKDVLAERSLLKHPFYAEWTKGALPKYKLQDLPMGSSKSPQEGLSEIKARHKGHHDDWYAVAKGKDGATGVFDSYEEAKGLVYRVSGAIWKWFKTYDEAWIYVQSHLEEESDSDPEWFYGVANGKDDFNGVLTEYPSTQKLVERISGAS